jgi:hypothetical protein
MQARNRFLLLGALALGIVLTWLWIPQDRRPVEPPAADSLATGSAPPSLNSTAQADLGDAAPEIIEESPAAAAPPLTGRELAPSLKNPPLRFRIIDQAGTPVGGIEIAVGVKIPFEKRGLRLGTAYSRASDGLAEVTIDRAAFERTVGHQADPTVMADAQFPALKKVRVSFAWSERFNGPIEIRLPEFQWVDFEVHLPNGELADIATPVSIFWAAAGAEDSGKWSNKRSIYPVMNGPRGRFPCAFGLDLNLWTHCVDEIRANFNLQVTGPTAQAQLPTLILTLGARLPRFRARLFLPDGSLAANQKLAWYLKQKRRPIEGEKLGYDASGSERPRWKDILTTDAEGVLEMSLRTNPYTQVFDRNWTFILQHSDRDRKQSNLDENGAIQVSVDLPFTLQPGEIWDPGDLHLRELVHPLLASGTVSKRAGGSAPATLVIYEISNDPKLTSQAKMLWRGLAEGGRFEAHGPAPAGSRIRITAGGYGYLGEEVRTTVGAQNIEFLMVKGANVRGHVLLDEDLAWHLIDVRMQPGRHKSLGPGNTLWVDYVRPGSYWMELKHGRFLLWRAENILIEESGDVYPVQLQGVDLRGQINQWKLHLVDENGENFPAQTTVDFLSETGIRNSSEVDLSGKATQLTSNEIQRLKAGIRGYQPIDLSWPPSDQPIQLRKVIR